MLKIFNFLLHLLVFVKELVVSIVFGSIIELGRRATDFVFGVAR
jgi:hypothetical protein